MRIVKKINLTLAAAMAIAGCITFGAMQASVMPIFFNLEEAASQRNEGRAAEAIESVEEQLADAARFYTYAMRSNVSADHDPLSHLAQTMTPAAMKGLGLDHVAMIERDGRIALDLGAGTDGFFFAEASRSVLQRHGTDPIPADAGSSLVVSKTGPVALGYARIGGGSGGMIVFGRAVDLADLKTKTKVNFRLEPIDAGVEPKPALLRTPDTIETRRALNALDGTPVADLVTLTTRRNVAAGQSAIWWASGLIVLSMLAILVCVSIALRIIAVRRIERIRTHLASVGKSGDLEPMPEDEASDELSQTIVSFNAMAKQLAELRNELRHRDYRHGAADQAAGLLHNIRNAVSPISAIGWDLERREDADWRTHLSRVLDELGREGLDPVRAAKLNDLLVVCAREALKAGSARRDDLRLANEMLRHVEEMLREQDRLAQSDRHPEPVDIADAAARAVRRLGSRPNLVATSEVVPGIEAFGHRVVLDQILDNLVVNAAQAIEASGQLDGRIVLSRTVRDDAVEIAVTDNGDGIRDGDLTRIFGNGFSTRTERSGGLGLHWCANAAKAMGGSLTAESGGPGKGATLRLTLPHVPIEDKVAA